MKKLRFWECDAKAEAYEAYEACAAHMRSAWTKDPAARQAGQRLAATLSARAARWRKLGTRRAKERAEGDAQA